MTDKDKTSSSCSTNTSLSPDALPAWQALAKALPGAQATPLSQRFADDPRRAQRYSLQAGPLHADFSRHHLDEELLSGLLQLADACGLNDKIAAMTSGAMVNVTEQRPACHNRLRDPAAMRDDPELQAMFSAMRQQVSDVHQQHWKGATGKAFEAVVNIGIGGSDFGPRLVCDTLSGSARSVLDIHFVSNIDPSMLAGVLDRIDPETTLFILSSKSFNTDETLSNARAAKAWMDQQLGADSISHFLAVTASVGRARQLGISENRIVALPEWVGGRFSVWSAIGLPIALGYGFEAFQHLLEGGASIDQHVADTPLRENLPVVLGLLDLWYRNFWDMRALAVLPYDHHLKLLPDYLQQLFMESTGKSVRRDGESVSCDSSPVIWGSEGTNAQHSFFQMLHQGSNVIPCDFILPLQSNRPIGDQHRKLVANCMSQALVLMQGQDEEVIYRQLLEQGIRQDQAQLLARHRRMPGNRPSTLISFSRSNAESLGALIALYEYRMFVASAIWDINAFDQWGVELGKTISVTLADMLDKDPADSEMDSATRQLIQRYRQLQE